MYVYRFHSVFFRSYSSPVCKSRFTEHVFEDISLVCPILVAAIDFVSCQVPPLKFQIVLIFSAARAFTRRVALAYATNDSRAW